jgi:hypothetical protein
VSCPGDRKPFFEYSLTCSNDVTAINNERRMMLDPVAVERAEKSIDEFINSRSKAKEKANKEEEEWRASERRVREKRRRENRAAWLEHHAQMQTVHLDLAARHADKRSRLMAEDYHGIDEGPGGEAA